MHENDFELLETEELAGGNRKFRISIKAASLDRVYIYYKEQDAIKLEDDPVVVGGHDMSSIIGKRVREWLRSEVLDK